MNDCRTLALDLGTRMADIEAAMRSNASLFNRDAVIACRDFAQEAQRQRGGQALSVASGSSPQQISDDLIMTMSRIDNLCNKLKKGRLGRDALVIAGLSIRAANME